MMAGADVRARRFLMRRGCKGGSDDKSRTKQKRQACSGKRHAGYLKNEFPGREGNFTGTSIECANKKALTPEECGPRRKRKFPGETKVQYVQLYVRRPVYVCDAYRNAGAKARCCLMLYGTTKSRALTLRALACSFKIGAISSTVYRG